MLNIISSRAEKPSPCFQQSKRRKKEGNLTWLKRHVDKLAAETGAKGRTYVVLIGGRRQADFRLRVAQGHVRHDMSPSHWSHVVVLQGSGWSKAHAIWEISLDPDAGFGYPPSQNAVQRSKLDAYKSAHQYPNLAAMRLPVALSEIKRALQTFQKQRSALDAVELTLVWLGYAWGVGRSANPLLDGVGIPSAAFVETLVGAAGFDLTPGLDSRASCPEAIWQSAKHWHEYYGDGEAEHHDGDQRIHGFWHTEHFLGT